MALSLAALLPAMTALGTGGSLPESDRKTELQAALHAGAELYAMNCAVCHGRSGGGLVEARTAFPPDERHCVRCHKPNNPVVQPLTRPFVDNDMFPVGDPPALHAEGLAADGPEAGSADATGVPMAEVVPPEALFGYVKATMPRYDPGRHSDAEYWLMVAYLLELNGREEAVEGAVTAASSAGWTP